MSEKKKIRLLLWLALGGILCAIVTLALFKFSGADPAELKALASEGLQRLQTGLLSIPLPLYIAAFITLPAIGTPVSVFYLTVATVAGSLVGGLFTAWLSIAGNCALCYWIGAKAGREYTEKLLERKGLKMPEITVENHVAVTIMLRLSPLPFVFQNYGLALAGVPFRSYMIWSVLAQGALSAGVIIVGGSLFEGNFKYAFFGLFLFFAAFVAVSWWRRQQQKKNVLKP